MERFAQSAEKMFFNNINFQEIKDNLISIASNYDDGYMRVIIGRGSDKDKSDVYIFYQELINFPESFTFQSHLAHWHAGGDFDLNEVKKIIDFFNKKKILDIEIEEEEEKNNELVQTQNWIELHSEIVEWMTEPMKFPPRSDCG